MRETLDGYEDGLLIGGRISNLRYADDIILIATLTSEQELQVLVDPLTQQSIQFDVM